MDLWDNGLIISVVFNTVQKLTFNLIFLFNDKDYF
jgi:hypothetical protein